MKTYHSRILCLAALLLAVLSCQNAEAKRIAVPHVYVFGLAASFTDSLVYITDIQSLDSAWVEKKTGFLQDRSQYSYQLRDYLADKLKQPHRTCIVFYNQKREKLQKKLQKITRLYTQPKDGAQKFEVRRISATDFSFRVIDLSEEVAAEEAAEAEFKAMSKGAKKALVKAEKAKKKEKKKK